MCTPQIIGNCNESLASNKKRYEFHNLRRIYRISYTVKSQTNLPTVKLIVCVSVCLCVYSVYTAQGLQCDEN